jgi:hypothetical protein
MALYNRQIYYNFLYKIVDSVNSHSLVIQSLFGSTFSKGGFSKGGFSKGG